MRLKALLLVSGAAFSAMIAQPVFAADGNNDDGEIIVTARKQQESILTGC